MPRRVLTALAMAAVGLPAIIYGGIFYFLLMGVFLVGGAWEYIRLYRALQFEPHEMVTVGGVLVIMIATLFDSFPTGLLSHVPPRADFFPSKMHKIDSFAGCIPV